MKKTLTTTAIELGKGKIDWGAATQSATWDSGSRIRQACEDACGPSEEAVRALALSRIAAGLTDIFEDESLTDRVNYILTDAASVLIAEEAERLIEEEERAEQVKAEALRDRKLEAVAAIEAALGARCELTTDGYGGFGSLYLVYRFQDYRVDLRVSDHAQVAGGGFNMGTGERNGEVNCSFVIDSPTAELPTRQEIRNAVAVALMDQKC